jgi:hypothetical protein
MFGHVIAANDQNRMEPFEVSAGQYTCNMWLQTSALRRGFEPTVALFWTQNRERAARAVRAALSGAE